MPVVCAATGLEAQAARCRLPREVTIERIGVGLRDWSATVGARPFISFGLAGGLAEAARPGTILVPECVGLPDGERLRCHPVLVERLVAAARRLGYEPLTGPLLTAPQLVVGPERRIWAERGFVAVDMETGLLLQRCPEGAALRIALDAPDHELSPEWSRPARALTHPSLWPQAARLALTAPTYALRAAAILRAAFVPHAE
ncbi:MAG: hypothetical protein IT305_28920 [Chloroflexi bacterium]|nr:hypothetical protein [Chloroflexota bacterium]